MEMHIKNVHLHLGHPAAGAAILALIFSATREPDQQHAAMPAIGEYWKGQGGVYAGMGRGRDGGKDYCLILPTDPRATFKRAIGTRDVDVTGATSDHDGPANTAAYAAAGSDLCKGILALDIEGHQDFYLMSRTDAQLCWANIPEQLEKAWYLTSTQFSRSGAWYQHFGSGDTFSFYGKSVEASARACRRLFL